MFSKTSSGAFPCTHIFLVLRRSVGIRLRFRTLSQFIASSIWKKVNISNKLLKIGILLADNGFVTILKQLPMTLMAAIKTDGITSKKSPHHRGERA